MTLQHGALVVSAAALFVLQRPLITRLEPETVQAFATYSQGVKKDVESRISARSVQFAVSDSVSELQDVKAGNVFVRPRIEGNPVTITDGLVHDWTGDVFIPQTSARDVIAVLQDFNHHAQIYPSMTRSRLLQRSGDHVSGYWRMTRTTGPISITLDIYDHAEYRSPAAGKWLCEAYTPKILQIDDPGTTHEKILPETSGYGFLWRFDAYWLIEEQERGVLVECRTLSLSRSIPGAVAWMIKPFVDSQPREALRSTLESTRSAVQQRRSK